MSATDEHEIKLEPRYPESRHEDITDAFMRGHLKACETSFKAIKELEAMNKRLRKENDTLCRRIDELCAENERLRQENQSIGMAAYELGRKSMADENDKLREAVATAIKVQAVLCGDADSMYCRKECPLHRQESDDCLACDVIEVAQELEIEVPL